MHRLPVLKVLLSPSLLSGSAVAAVSIAILGSSAWTYISSQELFYAYLFGPDGIVTLLMQEPDRFAVLRTIFASQAAYYGLVILAAVATTLLVYALLETSGKVRRSSLRLAQDLQARQVESYQETLTRLWARLVGLAAWGCYSLFFMALVVPFSILLVRTGVDAAEGSLPAAAGYFAGSTLLLVICLHVHVVFLRLVMLRYRVFGGADTLVEEELRTVKTTSE